MTSDDAAIVEELHAPSAAEEVFRRMAARPHCIFFDSARRDALLGRYSFVAADPFEFRAFDVDERGALEWLRQRMTRFTARTISNLPPFQGGAAGLLSYDLGRQIERLPAPAVDEFKIPALAIGLYDVVVAFDHEQRRAWIISQGFPEQEHGARRDRAAARLREIRTLIAASAAPTSAEVIAARRRWAHADAAAPLSIHQLAPQHAAPGFGRLTSNFSQPEYLAAVDRAIEYIRAGDIFQVNLAQRLLHPAVDDALDLYLRLRRRNAATFAAYFDLGQFQITSASPERFLRVVGRQVESRPIKGTRRRAHRPEADLFAGDDLQQSEKDRAENVMIVDLLRNDLSRVCRRDSVRVSQLCRLETYEYVQHLVSAIEGELDQPFGAIDLVEAAFPGGSITGAPKVRAMQIIAELEPTARGAYCGCLAYLSFDGALDTSILIRTVTAGRGWWQIPVGGGIVAQSSCDDEYRETWHKAHGMLQALAD